MATMHRVQQDAAYGLLFVEDFDAVTGVTVLDEPEVDGLGRDDGPRRDADVPMEPDGMAAAAIDIAAIREQAFAEGQRTALSDAQAQRAAASRLLLETAASALAEADGAARALAAESAGAVARTLLAMFAAALPACCARHGAREAAALTASVLPALTHVAEITIRISPHARDDVESNLAALDADLRGRIRVLATDAMAAGDVRIAWRDGEIARDTAAFNGIVASTLAALGLAEGGIAVPTVAADVVREPAATASSREREESAAGE